MKRHITWFALVLVAIAASLAAPGAASAGGATQVDGVQTLSASRDGVHQIEQRLSQMNAAVELLTDTTESGLQSAFGEIQRLLNSEIDRLRTQPALQMRVVQAADDGRTAREIAQREGMSEGEAHLRMVLSKPAFSGKAAPAR